MAKSMPSPHATVSSLKPRNESGAVWKISKRLKSVKNIAFTPTPKVPTRANFSHCFSVSFLGTVKIFYL